MRTINYIIYAVLVVAMTLSSCSKESPSPGAEENQPIEVEGEIKGNSWLVNGSDLPSPSMRNDYDRLEFDVDDQLNFSWKWVQKNGQIFEMTGYIHQEKSAYEHENGASIWNLYLNVTHINGQNLPGGYYGIYSYSDPSTLLLNVEPDVTNWGDHPEASKGLGSGASGLESVYAFTKQ
ncbi:MAG: hypothetical protein JXR19_07475 [Bacteroidia bacterium]